MTDRRIVLAGAALVTLIMLVSSMGLVAGLGGNHAPSGATPAGASSPSVPRGTSSASQGSLGNALTAPAAQPAPSMTKNVPEVDNPDVPYGITQAEHSIESGQVPASAVMLPRAPSSSGIPAAGSPITGPSYPQIPAPMGLGDFGQSADGPYEFNTSSFAATLQLSSFQDYNPGYSAWDATPDWMTFQLNTVTVNTSYPGSTNGSFWIQNVVHFNGTSLQFEDNIWNFSSAAACLGAGTLLTYYGQQDGCFYYVYGPTFTVSYPFTLTLYNNLTIYNTGTELVPGVYFNYTLQYGSTDVSNTFDFVTFNGTASYSAPPQFQVNGFNYNPLGYLFYDAEIIFGGNGGGANANIVNLTGTATLDSWDAGSGSYVSVPSAYDYGGDTGETSLGVAATWSGTTEYLSQGPSMLYGLWNTANGTFGPAATNVALHVNLIGGLPSDGFLFVTNNTDYSSSNPQWSYWPSTVTGTASTVLPWMYTDTYYDLRAIANGNDTEVYYFGYNVTGSVSLPADPTSFTAPVYLSSDGQVATFGSAGLAGVQYNSAGDLWINDTMSSLDPAFRLLNDFLYPSFMLFAEYQVSDNISIDHFIQDPTTFNYTSDGHGNGVIENWTQGYYFNFGTGIFSISDVTVIGNSTLYYQGIEPLPAVEFWGTAGESASNIVTGGDGFGVDLYYTNDVSLDNIAGETGANAVAILYSYDILGTDISSNGTDIGGFPTWALYLTESYAMTFVGVTAQNDSLGIDAAEVAEIYIDGFNVYSGAVGLEVADFEYFEVVNAWVGAPSWAGFFEFGNNLYLDNWTVAGAEGLEGYELNELAVAGFVTDGFDSIGLGFLEYVQNLTATDLTAENGAEFALLVEGGLNISVSDVNASGSSGGVAIYEADNVDVTNVVASDSSVGSVVAVAENVTVNWANATDGSLAVALGDVLWGNVTNVNVSEPALSSPYYYTDAGAGLFATAAVEALDVQNVSVAYVSALNYNFGVFANDTLNLVVVEVTEWNGDDGVALNDTQDTLVVTSFLYGNDVGLNSIDSQNLSVFANTIEGSASYGLALLGGNNSVVEGNNFVANNGASTDGTFSATHVQALASVAAGNSTTFDDNYWSDWTSGAYVISATVSDSTPVSAFINNWLVFDEVGLPAGTPWGYTLDGVNYTTSAPLVYIPSWSLPVATLQFTVNPPTGYTPTPASGSIPYAGSDLTTTIVFAAIPYTVTFEQAGLPVGAPWSVTLNGTTVTSTSYDLNFTEIEGSYSYSVGAVSGYAVAPSSGSVTVNGANVTVELFYSVPTYSVTFTQSTLTPGTSWSVTLDGSTLTSTSNDLIFTEANGTYPYTVAPVAGYTASPSSGSLLVSGPTNQGITYTAVPPGTYAVTFTETGLASGQSWSVTFNGTTTPSTGSTIQFTVPNGTYDYVVAAVSGYSFTVSQSSPIHVAGAPVGVDVTFSATPTTYQITFTEAGLASGTTWTVTLDGSTESATAGASISFLEPNGQYSYTIGGVTGYTSSASLASPLTVSGGNVAVTVTYTASSTSSSGSSGLSTLDWAIIGVVIAAIVVGLVVALVMRGRGGGGKPAEAPANPPVQPWKEGSSSGETGTPDYSEGGGPN